MDISALSSNENFDEIDWINSIFKNTPKGEKEKTIDDAVSKLQLYVQQANVAIESTTNGIISSMPQIANDSKNLLEQTKELKVKMNLLEKDISKSETAFSMANLERLDDLKIKLEAAKMFLEQNDSFSKLTNELEDLLESEKKDVSLACEKLFALQKSYEAQLGLAGQAERAQTLEEFKNRLEASITNNVIKALGTNNVDESLKFVEMFTKIDRLPQMKNYYGSLQRDMYGAKWNEIRENSENSRFLADFYEFLLNSWGKQLKWYRDVFKSDGVTETIQVFTELLSGLNPSRESAISSHLKRVDEKMEFLAEISEANEKFEAALTEKIEDKIPDKLKSAIYDFFSIFIVQYSSIEQSFLTAQLEELKILQSNSGDTIRQLESASLKVFELTRLAIERQTQITQNCALVSLVYILNTFFKSFLEKVKKAQLQLEASRSDHQDWNLLQLSINFLNIIGSFKMNVDEVEEKVKRTMLAKMKAMNSGGYKLVGQRDVNEFEKITSRLIVNEFPVIFESLSKPIEAIAQDAHQTILRLIFAPIENFFRKLEISEDESSADLPDYSFTPHEYITEIGQFLLTLPQNLEPLLLNPAKPLKLALEISDATYKENIPSADVLLSLVVLETCVLYENRFREIMVLSDGGAKQLATDIEYLASVLEELGLTISMQLKTIAQLLKIKPENYSSETSGIDAHQLVATIRQMRNIQINDSV